MVRLIMGDDCTPGRGIRDVMQPEADKPEAVDCAAVEAEGLSRQAECGFIGMSPRPVMVS